jgi:membrane-associated phospholipid phosphatase
MFKGPTRAIAGLRYGSTASVLFLSLFLASTSIPAAAQSASGTASPSSAPSNVSSSAALPDAPQAQTEAKEAITLKALPLNILKDQGPIWTSPLRIRAHDLIWLLPLAAATGIGIATDQHVMNDVVSKDPSFNQANIDASNVMIGGLLFTPAVLYGVGHFNKDEHARETGLIGAEAIADGVIVEQGLKLIFWRERPNVDNAHGLFWQSSAGVDSSLPSSHSVLAWSTAAVLAGEYPSAWSQIAVYSLATGVSVTRVLGQEHFPTDVLVGSATGWLVGHYVYRHRHKHVAVSH